MGSSWQLALRTAQLQCTTWGQHAGTVDAGSAAMLLGQCTQHVHGNVVVSARMCDPSRLGFQSTILPSTLANCTDSTPVCDRQCPTAAYWLCLMCLLCQRWCRMALLEGHIGPVWSLSYSRGSGSVLATGGADRTVRLFSCPKGENIMELVSDELTAGEEAVAEYNAKAAAGLGAVAPSLPGAGTSSTRGRGAAAAAAAAGGAAGTSAAAGAAATGGGAHGHGHGHAHAPSWQPYQQLKTFTTQSMPVVYVEFSPRNLLLAGGPWTLQPKVISSGQHVAAGKGR